MTGYAALHPSTCLPFVDHEKIIKAGLDIVSFLVHSCSSSLEKGFTLSALKNIHATFYQNERGTEPVRDWLKELTKADRRIIGNDIATVEYGFPVGMPVCRPLGAGLWEVRCNLTGGRIARVIFSLNAGQMLLLHGFIKKTQKTPPDAIALARQRQKESEH